MDLLLLILMLAGSYLLGSVSPSYFLGLLKGIDIRKHGTKNAGAKNAWSVLGKKYGSITAGFDIAKGFIMVFLSDLAGIEIYYLFFIFLAVLIGHNYPFYLKSGGSGLAVTIGASMGYLLTLNYQDAIILLLLSFTVFYLLTRMVIYPSRYGQRKIKVWRKILRFAAIGLPLIYVFTNKLILLWVMIPITIFFLAHDLVRYVNPSRVLKIFTKRNEGSLSGMSYFMLGGLFAVLLFEKDIAVLSLIFLSLGDNLAVIFGKKYGKDKILGSKTLEGSFFFLASSFFGGLIFLQLGLIQTDFFVIFIGALAGALAELFSMRVDDNLTVPVVAGLIMTII